MGVHEYLRCAKYSSNPSSYNGRCMVRAFAFVLCTNEDFSPLHNGEKTECGVERSHEMVWNIVQTVLTWLSDGCDSFEVE